MKRKIQWLCMTVIVVCLWLLWREDHPAALPESPAGEGLRVALSQAEPPTPWKTAQISSFQNAARRRGMELVYHEPAEYSPEWQRSDLEALMEEDIDYLVLIPAVQQGYDEILEKAKLRNIPVILVEQNVEMEEGREKEDYYLTYVAPDYFKEGELCADLLAEYFGIQPCHTMVIQGEQQSTMARERYQGFMHGVRNHPNVYISKRVETSGSRLAAQRATELTVADQEIDFNAVFAPSDEDGLGALQGLRLAGVEAGSQVVLVSIGGTQDVVKAIISGGYLATVKSQTDYGGMVMGLIRDHAVGHQPMKRIIPDNEIYTGENAEEALNDAY